ncbi:hypothetical protein P3T36_007923 [Kitasatospora sp. MAP12-15]|uniref:hypothetical protein n=1 Tax=unclassified Kitasatospora TaxID=2633591 RepID=UPI0024755868|nr:hypothetical protein [Kitasatospora sp. MAP12-44]MDH6113656.1 hypothetical protein [Kitasatospora sp. MAP12-44]
MSDSLLSRLVGEQRRQAEEACAELREVTEDARCPLPSLAVESASVITGTVLVQMGGATPEVVRRLAEVLRAGVDALAAEDTPSAVSHRWEPSPGDLVVDVSAGRVGEFCGEDDSGRWLMAPPTGGEPWPADPGTVRVAGPMDQIRAEAARVTARSKARVG